MNPLQEHGAFSWFELMTSDTGNAKKFYSQLFGWTLEDEKMPNGMVYTIAKAGDKQVAGIMSTDDAIGEVTPPPCWGIYITVNNVDETINLAQSLGANILVPPSDIPDVGRFAVLADPQGAVLSVITYKS